MLTNKGYSDDDKFNVFTDLAQEHVETLKLRWRFAKTLCCCEGASIADCEEAVATLEEVIRTSNRVCGRNHPAFANAPMALEDSREALARARARAS